MIAKTVCLVAAFGLLPAPWTAGQTPARTGEGPGEASCLVVGVALGGGGGEAAGLRALLRRIASFHGARTGDWDGKDRAALLGLLRAAQPGNVIFVVGKDDFDVHLHRRVLLACPQIDDDPFADFAFGYITGRDFRAAERLWERIEALHREGARGKTWIKTSVATGVKSYAIDGSIGDLAKAAGFEGRRYYFGESSSDPDVVAYVDRHLPELEKANVISLTGNGDPQGIWLFDGRRNLDRSLHWPFDPAKVGHDPGGAMPRILASRFRDLRLPSSVVWSGTCHSGATRRVFVEGDIVSTFGRSDTVALYEMAPDESLCLALIDAGAAALLVPVASNHGMSVSRESEFALVHGATLGEAMKSTYDDLLLQCGGELHLSFEQPGERPDRSEHVMRGGGANRVLIGDPALRIFPKTEDPRRTVEVSESGEGLSIAVSCAAGFHASDWDMYGDDRRQDWRTYVRIPLPAGSISGERPVTATVEAFDDGGAPAPHAMRHAAIEDYHGRRFLHLQANGPRDRFAYKARRVVFRVRETDGAPPAGRPGDPSDPDTLSVDALIDALYATISGDAGEPRDWNRFRKLFAPSATLAPLAGSGGNYDRRVLGVEDYIQEAGPAFRRRGFFERETERKTERFGALVHVWSSYEARTTQDGEPFTRGVNSIQIGFDGGRHLIHSIAWASEPVR